MIATVQFGTFLPRILHEFGDILTTSLPAVVYNLELRQ
jgi:hypothetical protein